MQTTNKTDLIEKQDLTPLSFGRGAGGEAITKSNSPLFRTGAGGEAPQIVEKNPHKPTVKLP